ncbi:hypothetical protein PFLUV_G00106680 [Perca fluviatilis]|uniref:Uncharacterized protein n=1 Tax=Perca fluviatilis TaxID=8168 RepID=A0A6A5E8J5_PERFL|nr:hypothetical protein PFLUV_G00106680 [Perca fluviatilis]
MRFRSRLTLVPSILSAKGRSLCGRPWWSAGTPASLCAHTAVTFSGITKESALLIEIPESHRQPELPNELSLLISLYASHAGSIHPSCPGVCREEKSIQHQDLKTPTSGGIEETWSATFIPPMRDMGGKEKKIVVIANVPNYQGSDKKTLCNESVSGKKNVKVPSSAVPPPIPMSPIVEKMEGLKAIRNRSNSLRLGRLAFYRHLEKVETMRCFWELKHVEMEGRNQQVTCTACILLALIITSKSSTITP